MKYKLKFYWQKKCRTVHASLGKNEVLETARTLLNGQEINKIIIEKIES